MSLGSALQIAQNSLVNVTRQTGVVSRNITDAGNENYTRREGVLQSNNLGSRVTVLREGVESHLTLASLQASGESAAQGLIADRLGQLNTAINGADGSLAPSSLLTQLHGSLQTLSAAPSDTLLANAAIDDARQLANALNDASSSLNTFRAQTDGDIAREVAKLNQLLADFHLANSQVVDGTLGGREVNDALDRRDALLEDIANIIPVNVLSRSGNDIALVTKSGATLYEKIPRNVTFDPQSSYSAGTAGNAVRIDGVPVIGGDGANTTASGSLSALVQLRDDFAPQMLSQLDEIARGLITSFAETDATGGGAPALAGLFTYSGGPGLPPTGTLVPGLAGQISVQAAYDPAQGGNASLLRDGGANGAAYINNTTGGASFSDRLISLVQGLDATSTFDSSTGLGDSMSILAFATSAGGWLDGQRSQAVQAAASKEALHSSLAEKISNQTGVNIDEEMALLLQLEHSYEASARMISTVDEMLATLLSVVR